MEIHELDAWWESYSSILDQPKKEYKLVQSNVFNALKVFILNFILFELNLLVSRIQILS